jgi:cation transport ATPase
MAFAEQFQRVRRVCVLDNIIIRTDQEVGDSTDQLRIITDTKKCPMCAEFIKEDALVCKHCGHHFSEEEVDRARQVIATEQRERAAAAERERQQTLLECERAAAAIRHKKAKCRRVLAWFLVAMACLMFMMWLFGATIGPLKDRTAESVVTQAVTSVILLFILLGLPALLLFRSAKRLARGIEKGASAEPITGANHGQR